MHLSDITWCLLCMYTKIRYQLMMRCWQNDADARPTFTELKNQLKDMKMLHKVRLGIERTKVQLSRYYLIQMSLIVPTAV